MNKSQYVFAQEIVDKLSNDIEQSADEWERGYNAGVRHTIRMVKKYIRDYEQAHNIKADG